MDHDRQDPLQLGPAGIEDRVAACEQLLADLRCGRAGFDQIRLKDRSGQDRLVANAEGNGVVLRLSVVGDPLSCVELFAHDPCDGEGAHVGLAVTRGGDVIGEVGFVGSALPRVWLEPGPREES